jgi:hypothetical protein
VLLEVKPAWGDPPALAALPRLTHEYKIVFFQKYSKTKNANEAPKPTFPCGFRCIPNNPEFVTIMTDAIGYDTT